LWERVVGRGGAHELWCWRRFGCHKRLLLASVLGACAVRVRVWCPRTVARRGHAGVRLLPEWPGRRSFRLGPAGECRAKWLARLPAHSLTTIAADSPGFVDSLSLAFVGRLPQKLVRSADIGE